MPDPTSTSSESNTRELSSQGEVGVSSESSSQDPTPRAEEEILCSIEDGLLTVTLNRPEVGNALHGTMRDRLGDIFDEASSTLSVRAVLLNARGKAFCTGADLRGSQVSR
ncbi:MAG TPA: enoyl-CoA hydratase/isomerase family protein, partial [Acidimicrobiales bacterium]|nr:enoyl-CoA hydratase/isomerase family protein [Acidimicrobiales bacterium]